MRSIYVCIYLTYCVTTGGKYVFQIAVDSNEGRESEFHTRARELTKRIEKTKSPKSRKLAGKKLYQLYDCCHAFRYLSDCLC